VSAKPTDSAMAEAVRASGAQVLLNEGIAASYGRISDGIAGAPGVEEVARGGDSPVRVSKPCRGC